MALPNYAPQGVIRLGCVPWSGDYSNVRLYPDLASQASDIAEMMTVETSGYTYVARNRRLKVSIEADRLYHVNYCMYRNASLGDGWIYCFVTDVRYVNDSTTELAIETDVFQTYLMGVDWSMPPCFIERETVPSNDDRYLLTPEPSVTMPYVCTREEFLKFGIGGFGVITCSEPQENETLVDAILNPEGYYASPIKSSVVKGTVRGSNVYYIPLEWAFDPAAGERHINTFWLDWMFKGLNKAGSIDSVSSVFTIPDFGYPGEFRGANETSSLPDERSDWQRQMQVPVRGIDIDGYEPHNLKLFYYPYTFVRMSDGNGSVSELRYEFLDSDKINIKYEADSSCQALVVPEKYAGVPYDMDSGFVTNCGSQGSWANNAYQNWVAQNAGTLIAGAVGIAAMGVTGGTSLAAANAALDAAAIGARHFAHNTAKHMAHRIPSHALEETVGYGNMMFDRGESMLGRAGAAAVAGAGGLVNAYKQPNASRGAASYNVMHMLGVQGVRLQRIQVKAEVAQQIDMFFDRWGYAVERIEDVNVTSRPSWNYVKTGGCAPRSANVGSTASAPFSRGRGTPADALSAIKSAFDSGITFWHTTEGFGDYSLANNL